MAETAPIHLDLLDVARAAKAAYDEGRLSAQGPTPYCAYRDVEGRPCAVGAALSDEQVNVVVGEDGSRRSRVISALVLDGVISTDCVGGLVKLQQAHDHWSLSKSGDCPPDPDAEQKFVAALSEVLAQVEA